jgi:hypothetical protein
MAFSIIQAMATLLLATSSALAATPTVHLGSATLIGRETSVPQASPANAYLGVPFAEPPKRFMPPEPLMNFTGTYDATGYKAACIQQGSGGFILPDKSRRSFQLTIRSDIRVGPGIPFQSDTELQRHSKRGLSPSQRLHSAECNPVQPSSRPVLHLRRQSPDR